MANLAERITVDPEQCGGRPCIRGMRIRVTDVLDLLANGLTSEQVVSVLPYLETEDIQACLRFASRWLGDTGCQQNWMINVDFLTVIVLGGAAAGCG